jgi:hypothetical protein
VARGVHVFVSNANHRPIIELYEGFSVKRLSRQSLISGNADFRGDVTECLLYHVTATPGAVSDRRPNGNSGRF